MLIETKDDGGGDSGGEDYSFGAGPGVAGCPKDSPNLISGRCDRAVQKEICKYDDIKWELRCSIDGSWKYWNGMEWNGME